MKGFRVTGRFKMGLEKDQGFTIEVAAESEQQARELIYTRLGSKHGAPRRTIHITGIDVPPVEELADTVVRHKLHLVKKQL